MAQSISLPPLSGAPSEEVDAWETAPVERLSTNDPALAVEGAVEIDLPVERMWGAFADVPRWPEWNRCMWRARVRGGELREGATLAWTFNAIRPHYPYKLPATATIVECVPFETVTWEAQVLGFHAQHSYLFADLGAGRSRFGSWEVAEGPAYRALRRFWLAHFRFVCRESLQGAERLAARDR